MLRMNQKIRCTRTELQKFAEYDNLECEAMLMTEDAMGCGGGVAVGSSIHQRLEEIGKELCTLRDSLKALMGTTRFNILMNDRFTMKAWRGRSLCEIHSKTSVGGSGRLPAGMGIGGKA